MLFYEFIGYFGVVAKLALGTSKILSKCDKGGIIIFIGLAGVC